MTTPITVPIVIAGFEELVERVRRLLERLSAGIDQVIENARRSTRLLPVVAEQVASLCDQLDDFRRRLKAEIIRLLSRVGQPWKVWDAGASWVANFAGPLSEHVGEMNDLHLSANYAWDGRAADMYAATTARQKEALVALQSIGADVHTALGHVAVAICALWAAVAAALLMACSGVVAAVASASTGIGAPAAVAFVFEALAALLAGVSVGVGGFMLTAERANDAMATLRNRLFDRSALDGGQWPGSKSERYREGASWKLAQ
ncbi:hypothetical protein GCM10027290_12640 [Micromonospora sonneratiae]|uniref:Proteins of 100 residues with WXG n=1 Tax=Micromonospora sonneratiae TaxID=1184706 RepID=A0ABW3YQY5_9ACTN